MTRPQSILCTSQTTKFLRLADMCTTTHEHHSRESFQNSLIFHTLLIERLSSPSKRGRAQSFAHVYVWNSHFLSPSPHLGTFVTCAWYHGFGDLAVLTKSDLHIASLCLVHRSGEGQMARNSDFRKVFGFSQTFSKIFFLKKTRLAPGGDVGTCPRPLRTGFDRFWKMDEKSEKRNLVFRSHHIGHVPT